jgi:hypothetical protein
MIDFSEHCPDQLVDPKYKHYDPVNPYNVPPEAKYRKPNSAEKAKFNDVSNKIISKFQNPTVLRDKRKVERGLEKLRKLIADMEIDVREELVRRECQAVADAPKKAADAAIKAAEDAAKKAADAAIKAAEDAGEKFSVDAAIKAADAAIKAADDAKKAAEEAAKGELLRVGANGGSALEVLERISQAPFERPVRRDAASRADLIKLVIANFQAHGGELSTQQRSPVVDYLDAMAFLAGFVPFDAPNALKDFFDRHV